MHNTRPYLNSWLRRTRRELSISGRLSEVSLMLSRQEGRSPSQWSAELRGILQGTVHPSLDLVTMIDTLLASPARATEDRTASSRSLF